MKLTFLTFDEEMVLQEILQDDMVHVVREILSEIKNIIQREENKVDNEISQNVICQSLEYGGSIGESVNL